MTQQNEFLAFLARLCLVLIFPFSALNKLCRLHPEIETDVQMLETVLAAEILGHYRSYQILDKLGAPEGSDDPIARALTESMQQELERIFRLLGLLHPHLDVQSVYLGLKSKSVSVYDNALEFLDNVLKAQLRDMLVPLLDGRVSVEERARLANQRWLDTFPYGNIIGACRVHQRHPTCSTQSPSPVGGRLSSCLRGAGP